MDDRRLITEYARTGSEAAFAELTSRYIRLVYATCYREVRNRELAEDSTQVVFLLLAQKASGLRPKTGLAGWLFHTSRLVSKNAVKLARNRAIHDQRLVDDMMETDQNSTPDWQQIDSCLNEALDSLGRADREAILLRYFEGLSLQETGATLDISEEAAKKRVHRAVEKLRRYFAKHGIGTSGAILASLLGANAVAQANTISADAVAHIAVGGWAGNAASGLIAPGVHQLLQGVQRTMLFTKVTTAAVIALAVMGVMSVYPMMAKARQTRQNADVVEVRAAARARYDAIDQAFNHHDAAAAFKILPHVIIGPQNNLVPKVPSHPDWGWRANWINYNPPWTQPESNLEGSMKDARSEWSRMKHDIGTITVDGNTATITVDWSFAKYSGRSPTMDKYTCADTWVKGASGWELQQRSVNAETLVDSNGKPLNAYLMNQLARQGQAQQLAYNVIVYAQDHGDSLSALNDPTAYKPFTANVAIANLTWKQIPDPNKTIMLYEAAPDARGNREVAFVDGHQDLLSEKRWKELSNFTTILDKK